MGLALSLALTEAAPAPPQLVNCGLSDVTVRALEKRGITSLFPIQKHVFEPARAGKDLIGRARTGSGKTLAFSLPVIEELLKARPSWLTIQLPGRAGTLPQSCRRKMECGWSIQHEHAPAALRAAAGPSVAVLQVPENRPPLQTRMTGTWTASGRGCMQLIALRFPRAGQRGDRAADAGAHAALHRAGAHARAGQPGGARVRGVGAHAGRRLLLWRCALAALHMRRTSRVTAHAGMGLC